MNNWLIKIVLLIITPTMVLSCGNDVGTKSNITGKYYNNFEEGVIHFVELMADSTYIHHYKNHDKNIDKVNKGDWKFIQLEKKDEIMFSDWESFGKYAEEGCSKCLWSVKIKDGELFFNLDLREEMNFYKKD